MPKQRTLLLGSLQLGSLRLGSLRLGRWVLSTAVCGVVVAWIGPSLADDAGGDKAAPAGVSVPDSPGATERIDKAHEKEIQKQWKTAAEFYQEAINKYPGRVLPLTRDPGRLSYQYIGIAPLVAERISKWPAEGLTIYRNAYGQTAADLLTGVPRGNIAGLENVFWNYFPTDAGKTAGIRLIDAELERGDFRAAIWFGRRLLGLHPALGGDRGAITYRTAIACYRLGDLNQANDLLAHLRQESPTDVGSIAGKDVSLVDSLTGILAVVPLAPTTNPSDADTYPSFGGLGGRGDLSTSSARPGASLDRIELAKPESAGIIGPQKVQFDLNEKTTISNNLAMGIMPVVDAGSLFFQDGRSVYAVDADSGAPLPGWLNTYGVDRKGRYKLSVPGRVRNEPLTLTVTPTAVLAVMGQPDRMTTQPINPNGLVMPGQQLVSSSTSIKLVCLDRETGRELWTRTPAELPESAAAVRTGSYTGTPLIIPANLAGDGEESVLVLARGGAENQFDDCYAICLSLKNGQYKWSTYLGSATRGYDVEGAVDPSQMSLAAGRVFVMTNLGGVAALDPADGRILWFNSYTRDAVMNPEAAFLRARRFGNGLAEQPTSSNSAWAQNPVFVSDGYVFVLPRDARELFVYDAGSGAEKNSLPMNVFDDSTVILGARDGLVCLTSKKQLLVVDWQKYQDGDQKMAIKWHEDLYGTDDSEVCGRGFMTAESIFIPTKNRIRQIAWKSRRIVQDYPSKGPFAADQGPGNILVTAHNVVVAGQSFVDVYTDLALVRQRYESQIAAAPSDPTPLIGYANALFNGGDMSGALARIDQAIDLIGGTASMRPGKDRDMLFVTMLKFAEDLEKNREKDKDKEQENLDWGKKIYDRAAAAAGSPAQNARYRLARGHFDHAHGDYAGEIQLCQEILSDDSMRVAMVTDGQDGATAAETAINNAITAAQTTSVYAPIEQRAVDALQTARQANDPDQLLAVATVYPNSDAAAEARKDAVHRFEADHQPEKAIAVLRRMYAGSNNGGEKSALLVNIANDFLAMPDGLGPALDRLCRASRLATSATPAINGKLQLPDGTLLDNVTFAEAIEKLRQLQAAEDTARLPDFHLATPEVKRINPFIQGTPPKIENVMALVHPLRDFDRADQILTWGPAGLSIYPAGATTPAATISQVNKQPIAAAWAHDHWLVWTASDVYQINSDGKLVWDFPLQHLPTLLVSAATDSVIDWGGEGNTDEGLAVNGRGNVQVINVNGQVIRVQGNINGRMIVRGGMVMQPPPAPPVVMAHPTDEQITTAVPAGDRVMIATTSGRLLALDFRSGQTAWQTRPVDHTIDRLLANPHFTVARLDDSGGSQIAVYDTPSGRMVGRARFGADSLGAATQLVNVALSEEGTLALTEYNQVFTKDLYEPWPTVPQPLVARANSDTAPFVGLNQPDQLLVHGGRLACLYDGGGQARGYDLSNAHDPTDPKRTASSTYAISLRMIGSRLFIQTPAELWQYNLADNSDHYEATMGEQIFIPKVHGVMYGKDYVIVINDPVDRGPAGQPLVVLCAYCRAIGAGTTKEFGYPIWQVPPIRSATGIMDWIGSEGGVYYLSKDNTLHLLRGARP